VIIDRYGAQTAYWVTSGCAIGALLIAGIVVGSLGRALAGAEDTVDRVIAGDREDPLVTQVP
jgi:hypothetical protein